MYDWRFWFISGVCVTNLIHLRLMGDELDPAQAYGRRTWFILDLCVTILLNFSLLAPNSQSWSYERRIWSTMGVWVTNSIEPCPRSTWNWTISRRKSDDKPILDSKPHSKINGGPVSDKLDPAWRSPDGPGMASSSTTFCKDNAWYFAVERQHEGRSFYLASRIMLALSSLWWQ